MVRYVLSPEYAQQGPKQLVYGLDTKQIPPWILTLSTGNALFSRTLHTTGSVSESADADPDVYLKDTARAFRDPSTARPPVAKATTMKIASLVPLPVQDLHAHSLVAELGLDSLVTMQLRNWIRAALEAFLQPSDIINAGTLDALFVRSYEASGVVKRLGDGNK
ncbi:hypothetical protein BDV95DRAFT_610687 [Massariosphaeria phaeospora]|uniref:Carrier domain-containing protein n=1 Tax=Massariosphaeria phaeospora TaxID=100035 RepID=A0A7C8I2R7_9PLEO|nr:hypothetical protein BDV95DRAFT_610687 [Massariosphaeria phaeospora]